MNQIIRQAFADAQAAFPFVIAQGRNIERPASTSGVIRPSTTAPTCPS